MNITLGQARDHYANRADIKSPHTLQAYLRAVDLLLAYLSDRYFEPRLPIQQQLPPTANELPIRALSQEDEHLLQHFAHWLQTPSSSGDDKRPYSKSTVE